MWGLAKFAMDGWGVQRKSYGRASHRITLGDGKTAAATLGVEHVHRLYTVCCRNCFHGDATLGSYDMSAPITF